LSGFRKGRRQKKLVAEMSVNEGGKPLSATFEKKKYFFFADMSVNEGGKPLSAAFEKKYIYIFFMRKRCRISENMYFVRKSFYQKHFIKTYVLDILICLSKNVKKNLFLGGF